MKKKNIIFGLLVVLMAVGSAIASATLMPKDAGFGYTRASDGVFVCTRVGTCDSPGPFPCKITVKINGITKNYQALEWPACAPALTHITGSSVSTTEITVPASSVLNPVIQ